MPISFPTKHRGILSFVDVWKPPLKRTKRPSSMTMDIPKRRGNYLTPILFFIFSNSTVFNKFSKELDFMRPILTKEIAFFTASEDMDTEYTSQSIKRMRRKGMSTRNIEMIVIWDRRNNPKVGKTRKKERELKKVCLLIENKEKVSNSTNEKWHLPPPYWKESTKGGTNKKTDK